MANDKKAKRPIEIVIAEKNPLLQSSLIKLFAGDERFTLLHMCPDGERFLSAVERLAFDDCCISPDKHQAPDAHPNRFYTYGVIARLALVAAAREKANL